MDRQTKTSPDTHNSFSDKLAREESLLTSVPSRFAGGVVDRAEQLVTHPEQAQLEIAGSFAIGAALTILSKDPGTIGIAGSAARLAPKALAAFTVADLARRIGGPMLDTWMHADHLPQDKEKLADNLGSAALDYPIAAAGGLLGGAVGAGLSRIPLFDLGSWRGATSGGFATSVSAPGFYKFAINAPVIYATEHLPNGDYPSFPHQLPVPKVKSFTNLSLNEPAAIIHQSGGIELNDKHTTESFGIHLARSEPVRLDLNMDGPGTDWAKPNDESSVLSVYVDGKYQSDLVLFGGSKKTKYTTALENLPAGNHTITLRYAREKSTPESTGIDVHSGTATAYGYANKEQELVDKYAPVLYGRNGIENNHTDVPMGLIYTTAKRPGGGQTIYYQYYYSNEDAGSTNPPANGMALLGRMTDIDNDLTVKLDKNGKLVSETFNSPGDKFIQFHGERQGTHPILRIANLDDMLADYGTDPLKFQYMPEQKPNDIPREDMQVRHPLWSETMGKELEREGKIDENGNGSPPVVGTLSKLELYFKESLLGERPTMADPRRYLYVQMHVENGSHSSPMDVRAVMKNGETVDSDLGHEQLAMAKSGWFQTALLLPRGESANDVSRLEFISVGDRQSRVDRVGRIYTLDQNFDPVEAPKIAGEARSALQSTTIATNAL